jgi:hypothetical protein
MSGTDAKEPEVLHGVTLEAYAAVHAALGEGMDEARALAAAEVEPSAWPEADDAWSERLSDDFADEGPLQAEYDAHLHEAQTRFARPLPPVDRELAPWLDLVRHFTAAEEPLALLKKVGLRGADMTRLHRAWSKRLGDEPTLRAEAADILARAPGPVPVIAAIAPPPVAKPAVATASPASPPRMAEDADTPPPIFGPLPTEVDVADVVEPPPATQPPVTQPPVTRPPDTQPTVDSPPAAVPPFVASPGQPPAAVPALAGPASMRRPIPPPEPAPASLRDALSGTAPLPKISLPRSASPLPFASPMPPPSVSDRSPSPLPFSAPLPASRASSAVAPPPSVPLEASPNLGDTGPIQSLSMTMMSSGTPAGDAMPFSRRAPSPSPSPPPSAPASAAKAVLQATVMSNGAPPVGPAMPFREGPVPSAAELRKQVSLNVYAAICAELAVHPERAEAVFGRYGLADRTTRGAVDAMYKADLAHDPTLRAKFEELVARAKTILR